MNISYKDLPSPSFILEEGQLRRNLEIVKEVREKAGVKIILALKGFSMWSVFPILKEYLDGATASSMNEVMLCNEEFHARAHTYAVAYKQEEFDAFCQKSAYLTFNSLGQYEHFNKKLSKHPEVSFGLRLNPLYSDVETDLYNPSAPSSRLGIHPDNVPDQLPEYIEGLHFHTLCESGADGTEALLSAIEERFQHLLPLVKWVNIGGGHLMTKKGYDLPRLIQCLKSFRERYDVELILEPGSAIAWDTGCLMTTVLDIIPFDGYKTAIIDASFTCHMPDCLEMPYKPKATSEDMIVAQKGNKYTIGGMSCLAGDFIKNFHFSKELVVGDRLFFHDMMHYTMVKTNFFNGVDHPAIVVKREPDAYEIVKKFDFKDYKARLS